MTEFLSSRGFRPAANLDCLSARWHFPSDKIVFFPADLPPRPFGKHREAWSETFDFLASGYGQDLLVVITEHPVRHSLDAPRGHKWHQYPLTGYAPVYHPADCVMEVERVAGRWIRPNGMEVDVGLDDSLVNLYLRREVMLAAEKFVVITDDHRKAELIAGDCAVFPSMQQTRFVRLAPGSLREIPVTPSDRRNLASMYFRRNYRLNAEAIFKKVLAASSDREWIDRWFLSNPIDVQILMHLDRLGPEPRKIAESMTKGSGKYPPIGSIDNLADAIQDRMTSYPLTNSWGYLTHEGEAFVRSLHPDTYDPDQAHREALWDKIGEEAKPSIDRYLRTFFGKNKVRIGKLIHRQLGK